MAKKYHEPEDEEDWTEEQIKADLDNHANQMNPNNDAYWSSRGQSKR